MRAGILSTSLLLVILAVLLSGRAFSQESVPDAQQPAATASETEGAPRLVFDNKEHDFGEIKQQQTVKHIFKFRNEGDALLVIEKVKPTCGCTGTLLSAEEIPPGEEGKIEVTFKSGLSSGKKKKMIYVYSNDPKTPSDQLHIMANIVVPVEVRPRQLYWVADRNEPSKKIIEFLYQPKMNVKIVKLEISSPAFKASFTPKSNGERPGYDIEVAFDGALPAGNFREKLTITTDSPDYPSFPVFIRGRIAGKVRVVPNAVALGVIKSDSLPSRAIRVYAKDNRDFEITGIEPTSPLISTEITKDVNSNGYRVKVALTTKPPQGAFSEKIRIKTSLNGENPLEVAVYAFVQ